MKVKTLTAWAAAISLTGVSALVLAGGGTASWGQFGNAYGPDENNVFAWPDAAEAWAGWANTNDDMYPMSFPNGGTIKFSAAATDGDVSIRFRFERLPFPDVDPAFETANVTLSGGGRSYCVDIEDRPEAETYSSFILYSNDRNTEFVMNDVVVTEGGDCDSGPAGNNAGDPDAIPVMPLWALGALAGLMALFGWRARRQ